MKSPTSHSHKLLLSLFTKFKIQSIQTKALQILQLGGFLGSHSSQFYETPSSYSLAGQTQRLN